MKRNGHLSQRWFIGSDNNIYNISKQDRDGTYTYRIGGKDNNVFELSKTEKTKQGLPVRLKGISQKDITKLGKINVQSTLVMIERNHNKKKLAIKKLCCGLAEYENQKIVEGALCAFEEFNSLDETNPHIYNDMTRWYLHSDFSIFFSEFVNPVLNDFQLHTVTQEREKQLMLAREQDIRERSNIIRTPIEFITEYGYTQIWNESGTKAKEHVSM